MYADPPKRPPLEETRAAFGFFFPRSFASFFKTATRSSLDLFVALRFASRAAPRCAANPAPPLSEEELADMDSVRAVVVVLLPCEYCRGNIYTGRGMH